MPLVPKIQTPTSARWARAAACIAAILLVFAARAARAEEKSETKSKDLESEVTVVPFVGGDSDRGFGGGFISSFARVSEAYDPYLLRLEGTTAIIARYENESVVLPYVDAYVLLDLPHVLPKRLKLRVRASYTQELELDYYGLGNASVRDPDASPESSRYEYVHPTLDTQAEFRLSEVLRLNWGVRYTLASLAVPAESNLGRDLASGSPTVRRLLDSAERHHVATFSFGLGFDSRDDIVNPHSGVWLTARSDVSPGGSGVFLHRWARNNGNARAFVPLVPSRLTLAARLMTDLLIGEPPLYELPRYDMSSAIGGNSGVRGIPAQRYWGKAKVIGNVELRSELIEFQFLGRPNRLGLTAFIDAGRVWADYESLPELDGSGLGLKYGLGGGPRWMAGKSFVLRFDLAWSKESTPLGFYLVSGHAF